MPDRKIVSPCELNEWLTGELQKVDGCYDCRLAWKYRLREPEKHGGCNWSELNLRIGEDTDREIAVKAALMIEARAIEQFNLEDEPPPPPRGPTPGLKMEMQRRRLYTPEFHLDANLINARQKNDAVNQLERWRDDGVIGLAMAGIAHAEAQAGAGVNAMVRKTKAASHIFTIHEDGTPKEDGTYARVEEILWSKAADDNQANDVEVVCEAIKWHAILITNDGDSKEQPKGILGNRDRLREQFAVVIYRPEEAVEFIRSKIAERDCLNAQISTLTDTVVPGWTGQD